MISYPSSFRSSRISDKENINPNSIKIKATGFSPLLKQRVTNNDSGKSEQFLSVFKTIVDSKNDATQNSMKTLLQGFCSTIQQTHENVQTQNFVNAATKYFSKGQLTRKQLIQLCLANQIYSSEQISQKLEGRQTGQNSHKFWTLKHIICTNLGELMIEQLCDCLNKGNIVSKQQQRIIQLLIPSVFEDEINSNLIIEHYDILKGQMAAETAEKKQLSTEFSTIHRTKIEPQLWSDHFRLEISKKLNDRQQRQRVSYNAVGKCFSNILTPSEISVLFRYIYAIEMDTLMPILDTSKSVSLKLLKANIFRQGQPQINQFKMEEKNINYHLQQNHKRIQYLQNQQNEHLQLLTNKDKQIERLERIIEFMKIEQEEKEKVAKSQMEIQLQSCRRNYEKKIEDLTQRNREQAKLTQWYQRQLEAVVEQVNKENVMRRYLVNKF